jgi:DNA-binding NarL/FixJ family response regulator
MGHETGDDANARSARDHSIVARVLVVDDQKVFRDVLLAVVDATPGLKLVGEAACGPDALVAMDELTPEFVIVDVRMPGMDGLQLASLLLERTPAPVVMLVSAQPAPTTLPTTADGSVVAFVAKEHLRPAVLLDVWDAQRPIGSTQHPEPDAAV